MKNSVGPQVAEVQHTPHKKLTDWAKEPTVLELNEDLAVARPGHDTLVAKINEWKDLRNVEGKAKPKTAKNRSSVQPKLVRRQAEWRYSALAEPLLSADNLFNVKPKTFEDVEGAKQNASMLDYQFRVHLNRVKFIDEYVRTAVDEGTVAVRLGWHRESVLEEVDVPIWEFQSVSTQGQMDLLNQGMQIHSEDPNGFKNLPEELQEAVLYSVETGQPAIAILKGYEKQEKERLIRNHPTLDITDFQNIYIDPNCGGDLEKAKFVIISFETTKADLLKDGRYKDLDRVNWSANSPMHDAEHAPNAETGTPEVKDELRKTVVAHEYWGYIDIHGNDSLVPIVATWIGDVMIRMEENPFPDRKVPLVVVPYLPIKDSVSGESDAELLSDNQAILGAVTRGMIDLLGRSANSQTGIAKGMLDPVNRRKYDAGADYEFNPGIVPKGGFHQHTYPEIPQSALTMLTLQNQDAEALTGIKAFSGGLSGEAYGEVAAGIRGMLDAASKREMGILRRLAQGLEKIASKIITMNQVFLSEEEVVRVTNEEFVNIRREDLAGEYDLEVDVTTAEIDQAQANDLSFMLQTLGNTLDWGFTQIILKQIAELKHMPRLAKMIEQYQPQPDPLDQQLKQLEIRKLSAEVMETESKAQLNAAKARKEMAEADLTDLNYVEQETGTTHVRDVDKIESQARSQERLKITEAIIEDAKPNPPATQQH